MSLSIAGRLEADRTGSRFSSGYTVSLSSRLVPRSQFLPGKAVLALVDAIQKGQEILVGEDTVDATFRIMFAAPSKTGLFDVSNPDTSINPLWYQSSWFVMYSGVFLIMSKLYLVSELAQSSHRSSLVG